MTNYDMTTVPNIESPSACGIARSAHCRNSLDSLDSSKTFSGFATAWMFFGSPVFALILDGFQKELGLEIVVPGMVIYAAAFLFFAIRTFILSRKFNRIEHEILMQSVQNCEPF